MPLEDLSSEFSSNKKSFINIFRLKRDIFNKESHIGFLIGKRDVRKDEYENGFGRILGVDKILRFLNHFTIDYQGLYSNTKEPIELFCYFRNLSFSSWCKEEFSVGVNSDLSYKQITLGIQILKI